MTGKRTRVIAHRGFSAIAPENTLAAFESALKLGVDGIEFDIRFSRDLEVMVIHDSGIERTTNGRGQVRDLTRSEIQAWDAGSWFDPKFQSETVPTLSQVLELAASLTLRLVIEIKPDPWIPEDFVQRILAHFPNHELRSRLLILSFDHRLITARRGWPAEVGRGALVDRGNPLELARQCDATTLAVRRNLVNPRIISAAHEAGLEVATWTVDRYRQINRFVGWGVDTIISNHPERVQQILDAPGSQR